MERSTLGLVMAAALSVLAPAVQAQTGEDQSYRAGVGLLNKGLSDLAATEFRRYLEEHPGGGQATNARYSLAVCLVRLGKHAEALPLLKVVAGVEGFEFAADTRLLLAQCHAGAGDNESAIEVLEQLVEGNEGFRQLDQAQALLGECLYRAGRYERAVKVLGGVGAKWAQSAAVERAELFAALAEAAAGKHKEAAERAARLREKNPRGEYALHAALVEGRARQQLREYDAAVKLFEAASAAKDQVRAEALLGLAAVSRVRGDLERAERALADAESVPAPLREWWTLEKGKLLYQQGNAAGALALFKEVRKSADEGVQAEAAYWSARCQGRQGKHVEAAANLEAAAERFSASPLVAEMLFERAGALALAGDDAGALTAWQQWRERFPRHELAADALVGQAWAAHRLGRFEESVRLLGELAARHADRKGSESVELLAAENAFARNEFEGALAAYAALVEHHPTTAQAARAALRRVLCMVELDRVDEGAAAVVALLGRSGEAKDAPLRRAALTAVADHAFRKERWKQAEEWFGRLASEELEDVERADALLRQGISVSRQGRHAEALTLLERVGAAGSTQARQAQFERGQCLLQLGRLDEARSALEQVAEGGDELARHARRHLAAVASRQGRHEDAAVLLAADGGGDADPGARLALGSAYVAAGKYAEALPVLAGCLEGAEAGIALKAGALHAIALNRLGRHEEAAEELSGACAAKGLDAETRAGACYELAMALRSLGRDSEAAEVLARLDKEGPARLAAYACLDLAQLEMKGKRFEPALALLDRCLARVEQLAAGDAGVVRERGTYLRASCLLQLGRGKEAADALAAFAQTFPESQLLDHARLLRGEALLGSGDARGAAGELTQAAASANGEVSGNAQLRLGGAWAACQEWAKSEQAFTTFLDRSGGSPLWFQARFGQGWARENQQRYDAALEAYRDVIARHDGPTAARAQFQVGECLYAQKKLDEAVAEFLKVDVLYAYPEWSAAALYEAGRCLEEGGRGSDAARQYGDLIKRFPDSKWAKLAGERKQAAAPAPVPGRGSPTAPIAPAGTSPGTTAAPKTGR